MDRSTGLKQLSVAGVLLVAAGEALAVQSGAVYGTGSASLPDEFGSLVATGLLVLLGVPALILAWMLWRADCRVRTVVPVVVPSAEPRRAPRSKRARFAKRAVRRWASRSLRLRRQLRR